MSLSPSSPTDFYLDFNKFGDLKRLARNHDGNIAASVAQQFEGLFLQQLLATMRSAGTFDKSQHSSDIDFYQQMYDRQLAQVIASKANLGVARLIAQQLPQSGRVEAAGSVASTAPDNALSGRPVTPRIMPTKAVSAATTGPSPSASRPSENTAPVVGKITDNDFAELADIERINARWQNPDNFVADLLPRARQAARKLGVSAELLIAQSALETGWGKHTMKFDDGRNSFNLFGIKAGAGWDGATLTRNTLEYRDGVLRNEVARFRAYSSPGESIEDYVSFIESSPRYQVAIQQTGDDRAYIRNIQQAGYATDPEYADKVLGIMAGEQLDRSMRGMTEVAFNHG